MRSQEIEKALLNYDIHFGITNYRESGNFQTTTIFQEELVLITSLDHPFKDMDIIDLADIKNENLIQFPSGNLITKTLSEAYQSVEFEPYGLYEVDSIETARGLVEAGLATAILPEDYLKYSSLKDLHMVRIKKPTLKRNMYIVYDELRYLPPSVNEFLSILKDHFKK